jgi:hypothetical protein
MLVFPPGQLLPKLLLQTLGRAAGVHIIAKSRADY